MHNILIFIINSYILFLSFLLLEVLMTSFLLDPTYTSIWFTLVLEVFLLEHLNLPTDISITFTLSHLKFLITLFIPLHNSTFPELSSLLIVCIDIGCH